MKANKHCTRITVGGNKITYDGDVGTPTTHLETAKLLFNSVLSRPNARFMTIDLANFYLMTPMDDCKHLRIKLSNMSQEIIDEYELMKRVHHGWLCIGIHRGACGLAQAGMLSHIELTKRLRTAGYFESQHAPGLWKHRWRSVLIALIVDDFGIEHVGKEHTNHLIETLRQHYEVAEDWQGAKFLDIDLQWNCNKQTVRLSMPDYINKALTRF